MSPAQYLSLIHISWRSRTRRSSGWRGASSAGRSGKGFPRAVDPQTDSWGHSWHGGLRSIGSPCLLLGHQRLAPVSYTHLDVYKRQILYWCGLRVGELLALEPNDIDLGKCLIHGTKSYQRIRRRDVDVYKRQEQAGAASFFMHSNRKLATRT